MAGHKRLTDAGVRTLRPMSKRYEVWYGGGFGVRVTPRGAKTWVYLYRYGGRSRRMSFGKYPRVSVADAGVRLAQAKKVLAEGRDPGAALVASRMAERQADTIADLSDEYLERYARPRKRTAPEDERILNKDVIPYWGRRKARDITRRDVVLLLDRIVDRGAPGQATRTLAVISRMFSWAVSREALATNPAWRIPKPAPPGIRDRVLSDFEIKALWDALEQVGPLSRLALRLQLVTAQRIGEIVGLRRSELNLDGLTWSLPAERSKNKRPHRIPISNLGMIIIEQAGAVRWASESHEASAWVFRSRRKADMHLHVATAQRALKTAALAAGLHDVRSHDLRRTAATQMAALGVAPSIIGRVLNHVQSSVTERHYSHHAYDMEKRQALEKWARRLSMLVGEAFFPAVVPLRA